MCFSNSIIYLKQFHTYKCEKMDKLDIQLACMSSDIAIHTPWLHVLVYKEIKAFGENTLRGTASTIMHVDRNTAWVRQRREKQAPASGGARIFFKGGPNSQFQ
jgi:hypothetical protein